jgi:hypothetical protein
LINFSLAISVFILERWLENQKQQVVFQAASESLFFYPAAIGVFVGLALLMYFLSLLLGGKGAFSKTLSVMGLSSFPLMFLFVPALAPLGIAWWGGLLILTFKQVHSYKYRYASLSVAFPLLLLIILMMIVGFFNLSFFTDLFAKLIVR